MDKELRKFHFEEFKQLRGEISSLLARVETLLKYAIVIAATVFSWLATQAVGVTEDGNPCSKLPTASGMISFAWYIPFAATILTGLMALVAFCRILDMGKYLARLEDALGHTALGWEKSLTRLRLRPTRRGWRGSAVPVW